VYPDDLAEALGPWPSAGGLAERLRHLREAALEHQVAASKALETTTDALGRFAFDAIPDGVDLDIAPVAEGVLFAREPDPDEAEELVDLAPTEGAPPTAVAEVSAPAAPLVVFHGRPARRVEIRATDREGAPAAARLDVKGLPNWREERFSRAPLLPLGAAEVHAYAESDHDDRPRGQASFDVSRAGPTPTAVIVLGEGATPEPDTPPDALSGRITGLVKDAQGRSGSLPDLRCVALRVPPGTDPASVTDERLRSAGRSDTLRGDRYAFRHLDPGVYVVAVHVYGVDGAVGPRQLVDLSAGPVTLDLAAPTQALLDILAATRDLRSFAVRVHAPDGLPKWTYLDVLAPDGARPRSTFCGYADETGWSILRAAKDVPELTSGALVRAAAHEHGSQVAPLEVTGPGRGVVRLRPWAALRVRVAEPTLRALGGRVVVRLAPLEVEPDGDYDLKCWMGLVTSGSETWLGPVPAGAYALRVAMAEREERDEAVHFHGHPVSSRRIDLAGGLQEITIGLEGSREVTIAAPGPGMLTIASLPEGDTSPPPVFFDVEVPEETRRARLDALPALRHLVAFTPEGAPGVAAVMILGAAARGAVEFSASPLAGFGLLVARDPWTTFTLGNSYRADPGDFLRGGDLVVAIDGAPISDALRPFGDRLEGALTDAPIALEVRRGVRTRTVLASPRALCKEMRERRLFLPYPIR